MGAVAKSYMRKGSLIYEEMRKYLSVCATDAAIRATQAKSSRDPMVAFTPKRSVVSRGEYNSKNIGKMSCN